MCSVAGSRSRRSGGIRTATRERIHVVLQLDTRNGVCARLRGAERHLVRDHGSSGWGARIPSAAVGEAARYAREQTVRIPPALSSKLAVDLQMVRHDAGDTGYLAGDGAGAVDRGRAVDGATQRCDTLVDPHVDVTV